MKINMSSDFLKKLTQLVFPILWHRRMLLKNKNVGLPTLKGWFTGALRNIAKWQSWFDNWRCRFLRFEGTYQ